MTAPCPHRLAAVAAALDGEPLDEGIRRWFVDAVPKILSGEQPANIALDVRVAPGQRSRMTTTAIATRDKLIREYACRYFPDDNSSKQAETIHRELSRYSTSAWLHERNHAKCCHPEGRRRLLWKILRARERVPGERTIYEILGSKF